MGTLYIPEIDALDYPAFRQIMREGELPATFVEYQANAERWSADEVGRGQQAEKVTIDPAKFARYCLQARKAPTLGALKEFAYVIAAGTWDRI